MWRPIHLIVPPSTYNPQRNYDVYRQTPLEGVTSIALVLRAAGYEVSVLDTRDVSDPLEWLISQVDHDSLFVGMTTFFNSFRFVKKFSARFKKEFPQTSFVIGGPMATGAHRQFLTWTDVDIVVLGEGEKTVVGLASRLENNEDLFLTPGIGYRTKNGIYQVNPPEGAYENLDDLPPLDWSIYPELREKKFHFQYMISRGCLKGCGYCFQITHEIKSKSPQRVEDELTYLKNEYGMKAVLFNDADLFNQTPHLPQVLEALRRVGVSWGCCACPEGLDPNKLKMALDSGCVNLRLGIESFDQDVLTRNGRNVSIKTMESNLNNAIESGIQKIICYFLLGLPGETERSLDLMVRKVKRLPRIVPRPFLLLVLPGTPIYEEATQAGLIKNEETYLLNLDRVDLGSNDEILLNLSDASDEALRRTFKTLLEIADERNKEVGCPIAV